MRSVKIYLILIPLILIGCIDTDLIDDPAISMGKLKIELTSNSVFVNDSVKLAAKFLSPSGETLNGNSVTWISSDINIVTINKSAYLKGVQKGQTYIIAEAQGFETDSLLVTVVDDSTAVSSVLITGSSTNISEGETLQLQAKAYNINGNEQNNNSFIWLSSDNAVLTVNSTGLVQAVSPGTVSVTASTGNVSSQPFQITVTGGTRTGHFMKNPSQDHIVSGKATLKENNDGTLILEFDSTFASSGGPDVRVYLSVNQSISGNSFEVGSLKSTSGKQSYILPSSIKINSYDYVLIHCVPFNITFGWAKLN